MAGNVEVKQKFFDRDQTIMFEWRADANGNVVQTEGVHMDGGTIHAFISIPGNGVTNEFDVSIQAVINTPLGPSVLSDALNGEASNLSNSQDGEFKQVGYQFTLPFQSELRLIISGAGANANGVFFLQVWDESSR